MVSPFKMASFVIVTISLCGCDQTRDVFGLTRTSTEEFAVNDRAPLSTPVHYKLAVPQQGAASKAIITPKDHAKAAVVKQHKRSQPQKSSSSSKMPLSLAEKKLLQKTGADHTDPSIRAKVNAENHPAQNEGPSIGEKLVFWKGSKKGDVIDPVAENAKFNG